MHGMGPYISGQESIYDNTIGSLDQVHALAEEATESKGGHFAKLK